MTAELSDDNSAFTVCHLLKSLGWLSTTARRSRGSQPGSTGSWRTVKRVAPTAVPLGEPIDRSTSRPGRQG